MTRGDVRPPGVDSGEKSTLVAFLNYLREAVAAKAEGLSTEQGRAPGVPSGTSVLGLIKHLTASEVYWFAWAYEGGDFDPPRFNMDVADSDTTEDLLAAYRAAIERSNEIIGRCAELSRLAARASGRDGGVHSMRWVLVHMIEDTARHAGHVDILREQLDGTVGR